MEPTELRDSVYDFLSDKYQGAQGEQEEEGFVGLHGDDKVLVIQQDGQHYVVTVSPLFPPQV